MNFIRKNYSDYKTIIKKQSLNKKQDLDWLEKYNPKPPKKKNKTPRKRLTAQQKEVKRLNQQKGTIYQRGLKTKATQEELHLQHHLDEKNIPYKFQKLFYDKGHCYIVDFYFRSKGIKLVVEIDGKSHDSAKAQIYDKRRSDWLIKRRHVKILRFKNEEVFFDVHDVIDKILSALS